mmetsp:Transcript_42754/g.129939  ORF Transcript_42754/g.129939 Transcript_42754/m.129939 type:complete len:101 (+) Transcript_42754:86-388(+)
MNQVPPQPKCQLSFRLSPLDILKIQSASFSKPAQAHSLPCFSKGSQVFGHHDDREFYYIHYLFIGVCNIARWTEGNVIFRPWDECRTPGRKGRRNQKDVV